MKKLRYLAADIFVFPIRLYQKFISPYIPARCRYYPSCSAYAIQAIYKHGIIKGAILGAWRILRCNPFARGGVDHVPEKFDLLYPFKDKKENNGIDRDI